MSEKDYEAFDFFEKLEDPERSQRYHDYMTAHGVGRTATALWEYCQLKERQVLIRNPKNERFDGRKYGMDVKK